MRGIANPGKAIKISIKWGLKMIQRISISEITDDHCFGILGIVYLGNRNMAV